MSMSPREAAKSWGVSRATIQRHIAAGKLSVTRDARGQQHIDPAEMQRAYGPAKGSQKRPEEPAPMVTRFEALAVENGRLHAENAGLRELIAAKDANLADMRDQVQRLSHAPARRSWWPWGKA